MFELNAKIPLSEKVAPATGSPIFDELTLIVPLLNGDVDSAIPEIANVVKLGLNEKFGSVLLPPIYPPKTKNPTKLTKLSAQSKGNTQGYVAFPELLISKTLNDAGKYSLFIPRDGLLLQLKFCKLIQPLNVGILPLN